jgi:hypothetical protein
MGIILAPILLAMFVGFSYHGIKSGVTAILDAPGRLGAIVALVVMSGFFGAAVIVVPFAFAANSSVSPAEFMLRIIVAVGCIAGLAGRHFSGQYVLTEKPIYGLCAAAFYLAAGSFPFTWFWLADSLRARFGIEWTY